MKELKNIFQKIFEYIDRNIFYASIICCVLFVLFPWIVIDNKGIGNYVFNTKEYNNLGDFVGGITAPILGLVTIYLLYKAYKVQKQELQETKTALQEQSKTLTKQRFEDTFFQLLNIHKTNVDEIKIQELNISGRACFKEFYNDLRLVTLVYDLINKELKLNVNTEQLTKNAYKVFFIGLNEHNKKHIETYFKDDKIFDNWLIYCQNNRPQNPIEYQLSYLRADQIAKGSRLSIKPKLFNGQNNHVMLSHYYRHLFHIVKFTIEQNKEIYKDTNEANAQIKIYLRMLRSQLSNYEQVMLYYNGVWLDEKIWFGSGYFTDYKMIHNLPLELADFGIQPNEHPAIIKWKKENKGKTLFEVEE
jgi:hypothetical protein